MKAKVVLTLSGSQLLLAVVLLHWGYQVRVLPDVDTPSAATMVFLCFGINAPAVLFRNLVGIIFPTDVLRSRLWSGFWFDMQDLLFLAGVALLWSWIGWELASARSHRRASTGGGSIARLSLSLFVAMWGLILFYIGLKMLQNLGQWNNGVGNLIAGLLFLFWAVTFISASGWHARNMLLHRKPATERAPKPSDSEP